ncbi:MAG: GTP cyclohydrolase II [Myxococcota bacterium]|nr:GTP cyclohydrolase II [Myxococcota bacterium]
MSRVYSSSHIVLTSHPGHIFNESPDIDWGNKTPAERGPVVASLTNMKHRNAIGSHSGSYTVYRALSSAAGKLDPDHRPDLTNTSPVTQIGPHPSWFDPEKIVSLDPWGAMVHEVYHDHFQKGYDIRPTIAVTKGHINMPEIGYFIQRGEIEIDGQIVVSEKEVAITKAAVEPVWYLPGIAKRIGVDEGSLRKILFQETGGMFPELVTRPDLKMLLPPIGSITAYVFGKIEDLSNPEKKLTIRVHDECNGSDVFGSDICTCRPYLVHGIEEAIRTAQDGGVGLVVYFRKEGRALGEVTKFLVYNARKRQEGGDTAAKYFKRTECVAGTEDVRFQELMPDVLHWLGITKIDRLISMSDMKYDAIAGSGIEVKERVAIPDERIPQDALVEMEAKKAAGYYTEGDIKGDDELSDVKGRELDE